MSVITRIRNNQVFNSDIHASKIQPGTIFGNLLANNFTYYGTMSIANLQVFGNTTVINTVNTVVSDPLFTLNDQFTGTPAYDLGLVLNRGSSLSTAFIWSETNQQFQLQYTTEDSGAPTVGNIDNSGFANLQVHQLTANSIILDSIQLGTTSLTSDSLYGNANVAVYMPEYLPTYNGNILLSNAAVINGSSYPDTKSAFLINIFTAQSVISDIENQIDVGVLTQDEADVLIAEQNQIITDNYAASEMTNAKILFNNGNQIARASRLYTLDDVIFNGIVIPDSLSPGDYYYDSTFQTIGVCVDFGGGFFQLQDLTVYA
jgi:hypothetical protein